MFFDWTVSFDLAVLAVIRQWPWNQLYSFTSFGDYTLNELSHKCGSGDRINGLRSNSLRQLRYPKFTSTANGIFPNVKKVLSKELCIRSSLVLLDWWWADWILINLTHRQNMLLKIFQIFQNTDELRLITCSTWLTVSRS